jgi:hypothetical protein
LKSSRNLFENENSFFNDDPEHHVHSALNSLNESLKLFLTPKAIKITICHGAPLAEFRVRKILDIEVMGPRQRSISKQPMTVFPEI